MVALCCACLYCKVHVLHRAPKLAFYSILGLLNLWQPFWPTLMKTQGWFLWQNWHPGWVVSRSGVTSVGGGVLLHLSKSGVGIFWLKIFAADQKFWRGTFTFVQMWCQNFLTEIFFQLAENFGWGVLYICPNLVSEFFGWNFFLASQKFQRGVTFMFLQKWTGNFFPNVGGTKICKLQNVMKHLDMPKFLT